jgi:hypothetical protein
MATLQWAHLCGYFVRGSDGRLSLIDLIDVIRAPNPPVVIPICVVTCWSGIPNEKFSFGVQMRGPENQPIPFANEIEVPFPGNQPNVTEIKTTASISPRMVELKQFGAYSVDLTSREIVVFTIPFHFVPVMPSRT